MTESRPRLTLSIARFLYGVYAWLVFALFVIAAAICVLLVPGLQRRRRLVSLFARSSLRLAGVTTDVRGLEKMPSGDCVVVANHASYVDGVILHGYLPPKFSYVIKGEMQNFPVVGLMLRRVGSRFVERFEASGSARDARQLLRAASAGESLALFPEGTFIKQPGLSRFRSGAFAAAIKAGVPVVPVVISGSRRIMPAGKVLPRHGHLRLDILNPIEPSERAFSNSRSLAESARQRILEVLEEPDLVKKPDELDAVQNGSILDSN
jgi:1-acyl-sn-glycerol-3-phosphate acyltransferase